MQFQHLRDLDNCINCEIVKGVCLSIRGERKIVCL
jgi:hypothetical protein